VVGCIASRGRRRNGDPRKPGHGGRVWEEVSGRRNGDKEGHVLVEAQDGSGVTGLDKPDKVVDVLLTPKHRDELDIRAAVQNSRRVGTPGIDAAFLELGV
jgi:hypothetical protein